MWTRASGARRIPPCGLAPSTLDLTTQKGGKATGVPWGMKLELKWPNYVDSRLRRYWRLRRSMYTPMWTRPNRTKGRKS